MSAANDTSKNNNSADALISSTAAVAGALRVAKAAQELAQKAPKPAQPTEIEKVAALLVEHSYIQPSQVEQVKVALADPNTAIVAMQNVIMKAAQAANTDPRLNAGRTISPSPTNRTMQSPMKVAVDEESEADRAYMAKVANYSTFNRNGKI